MLGRMLLTRFQFSRCWVEDRTMIRNKEELAMASMPELQNLHKYV